MRVPITTSPTLVNIDGDLMVVQNLGPVTVYYGNQNVSSTANVGSIASGASASVTPGYYFATASGSASILADPYVNLAEITGTPVVCEERTFTEVATFAAATTYTASVTIPAGATLVDIIVSQVALWTDATAASLEIGDATDPDGYYTAVDLKATDLLATQSLSFAQEGGVGGAYFAGTNTHILHRYNAAAHTITMVATATAGGGTAGRTRVLVVYALPTTSYTAAATAAAS